MKWLFALPDPTLDELLSQVSRSFYFSLAVLPAALRRQLSVAYLVARAGDTVADTTAVRAARRIELLAEVQKAVDDPTLGTRLCALLRSELLERLDIAVGGAAETSGERRLLLRLDQCLDELGRFEKSDRERTSKVLSTLIEGMERDLRRFPEPEVGRDVTTEVTALATVKDLDEHCYFAAGCVGEFWTLMTAAHVPGLERLARPDFVARGVRLGKALQYVNVLRDAPRDLLQGRCYIPRELLVEIGIEPIELRDPVIRRRARPLFDRLIDTAVAHVDAALPYVMAIPRREARLRLAALWPIWIGLGTLALLRRCNDPFDPKEVVRIPQNDLYKILAESSAVVSINTLLEKSHARRRAEVG